MPSRSRAVRDLPMCCAELRDRPTTQPVALAATRRGRKNFLPRVSVRPPPRPVPVMNDDRADRLRQQELIRRADAFEQTEAARDGFLRRFKREADPQGVLGEEERVARAVALRAEYMRKLGAG